MSLIDRIKASSWPNRIIALCLFLGVVLWLRVALLLGEAKLAAILLGVSLAWGSSCAAIVFLIGAAVLLVRRRPLPENHHRILLILHVITGSGLALTGALAFLLLPHGKETAPMLLTVGVILVVYGVWRSRQPQRTMTTILGLVLVIVATEVPREQGSYSLRWAKTSTSATWNWSGNENCNGLNANANGVRRPMKIAAYRPSYLLQPRGLRGDLGQVLAQMLGKPKRATISPALTRIRIGGRLDFGSVACYLPGYRSGSFRGDVRLNVHFSTGGGGKKAWAVNCNAHHRLSINLDIDAVGISSCQDLRRQVARAILQQIHLQARKITGR